MPEGMNSDNHDESRSVVSGSNEPSTTALAESREVNLAVWETELNDPTFGSEALDQALMNVWLELDNPVTDRTVSWTAAPLPANRLSDPNQPPTDDEVGAFLIAEWGQKYAFFHGEWQGYEEGWWQREANIDKPIWDALIIHKAQGLRPTQARVNSVKSFLCAQLSVPDEAVDQGQAYINLRNGLFNLQTCSLEEHNPQLYLTARLGYDYDPEARCPVFLNFLKQGMTTSEGTVDSDSIALLQEAVGYSLTADTSRESAFWLYGEARTGKSTFINVLRHVLGSAAIGVDLGALSSNSYQLADIAGKRVITCSEAPSKSTLNDAVYKQLVSGEEIVVRQIYAPTMRYRTQAKIWWAMNELPTNLDRSDAVYRRTKLIHFGNQVPEGQMDCELEAKLERELPGIFNWALEGLRRLQANNRFTQPARSAALLSDYRSMNDSEASFLNDAEWCQMDEAESAQSTPLYAHYVKWCLSNGHKPLPSNKIKTHWARLGLIFRRHRGANYYDGVRLIPVTNAPVLPL